MNLPLEVTLERSEHGVLCVELQRGASLVVLSLSEYNRVSRFLDSAMMRVAMTNKSETLTVGE